MMIDYIHVPWCLVHMEHKVFERSCLSAAHRVVRAMRFDPK